MPQEFNDKTSREHFSRKYSKPQSTVAQRVEEAVLGHAVGLSGYTTVDQARLLCERMNVETGALVLDIGTGRGWPGVFLARCMECRIVFTDMPVGVLTEAMQRFLPEESLANAVAADGRAIPFRSEIFDAIVYADVF